MLGYLIAGCGPSAWGYGCGGRRIYSAFAEIGVVLMLFVIGLELDPQRLWKLRASVFGGGALQMLVCGGLIGLFCMFLGLRLAGGGTDWRRWRASHGYRHAGNE